MRVAIVDYGVGNIHSLTTAFESVGAHCMVVQGAEFAAADAVVLPGVGNFAPAAKTIAPFRDELVAAISTGMPCLGVCLGMQLLLDSSEEGAGLGLGVIPGRVRRLRANRVPHMGWSSVDNDGESLLSESGLDVAYFANGFVCEPLESSSIVAWTQHESDRFASVIRAGTVVGTQFHPEKSSQHGLRFLQAFLKEIQL